MPGISSKQKIVLRNYLLAAHTLRVPNQTGELHITVNDRKILSHGTRHLIINPPFYDIEFALSSPLLARDIQPRTPNPQCRSDLDIQPNPLRLYQVGESLYIYLEFYNLMLDDYERTAFEISYEIAPPQKHEIDLSLFEALQNTIPIDIPKIRELLYLVPHQHRDGITVPKKVDDTRATRITIPYTGSRIQDMTYLQIDISHLASGIHKLTLTGRDLVADEKSTQTALFRIVPQNASK